ncbi:hypothetical protein ABI_38940 [Asticcacaulis biprosthecium C19]|uniref:Uncharacterized protein n=1 Tax=Asticcacaulis biprosthecium C19 TaxID=715226 RepID=F4QRW0_9CAUL|nr:hypothetical protein ABI_38940 [Asticcacaulis biprosthecium C19]
MVKNGLNGLSFALDPFGGLYNRQAQPVKQVGVCCFVQ